MTTKRILQALTLGLFLALNLGITNYANASGEPNFECVDRTLAIYTPAENWSKLETYFDGHLAFIASVFKSGAVSLAGPMMTKEGLPNGGLTIYKETDFAKVEADVKRDPFIQNRVAAYELKNWRECTLK